MSPKVVDKQARKREIAIAALAVIAERGFEGSSMSQIAEAVGIGKGTLYLYFESKADLMVAAAQAWVAGIAEGVAPLVDTNAEPLSRLRTLLRASTEAFLENPRVILLFLGVSQIFLRDPELRQRFELAREVSAPIRAAIKDILLDGVSTGVFRTSVADDADRIAINLVAFVDGIGLQYVSSPSFFDLSEQIDFYLEGLLESLRKRPATGVNNDE